GHQIGGELDAPEIEAECRGEAVRDQGLGRAGRPFQQDMAAREQRDEHQLDGRLLPDDGLADFGADALRKRLNLFYRQTPFSCRQRCSACAAASIECLSLAALAWS